MSKETYKVCGSYDARKLSSAGGSHWSDSSLSGRVSFILDGLHKDGELQIRNNSMSKLTIHNLREVDGGIYRCRNYETGLFFEPHNAGVG